MSEEYHNEPYSEADGVNGSLMNSIRSKWNAFSRQLFSSSSATYPKINLETRMIGTTATDEMRICDVDLCLTECGSFSNVFNRAEIRKQGQNPEVVCMFLKTINAFLEGLSDLPKDVRAQTEWIWLLEKKVVAFYGYTHHTLLPVEDIYTNIWFMNTCAIRRIEKG